MGAGDSDIRSATRSWPNLVAGGIGGMAATLVTSPLDVLRTRLQSDIYRTPLSRSTITPISNGVAHSPLTAFTWPVQSAIRHFQETGQILASIPRTEGWPALFKGLGPNLAGIVPSSSIKYFTYGTCKRVLPDLLGRDKDAALVHVISAALAGITNSTATNPFWVVKTRLQLDRNSTAPRYKGSFDCVAQIVRKEGATKLYQGLTASYLGAFETALHLTTYEQLKLVLAKRQTTKIRSYPEWIDYVAASAITKLGAAMLAYPHEVVRTRLRQAPGADGRHKYTGLVQCFRLILKEEGAVALYGGLTAHLLRTVPSAAIVLSVYEVALKFLERY